ncbi:hypothetical protein BDU57DRAFT_556786 [Ampelomyces quisqualis]|uniref:Fork-head domain-containing protein n=1 Tax=Ampelomyces quisqualis TaxID=50730 RepID=A0A6A5QMN1_AMPQU|nr:hypothetical protein BDU57DRAFT_556786 [Ampelomyces quisqualis]
MNVEDSFSAQWGAQPAFHTNNVSQHNTNSHILSPFTAASKDIYPYGQHSISYNASYDDSYISPYSNTHCPRSFTAMELASFPHNSSMSEAYPPAAYHIEQPKHYDSGSEAESNDHLMQMQMHDEYDYYGGPCNGEQDGTYYGHYSNMAQASAPCNGMSRYGSDMSGEEEAAIDKEQPYAQLIYLALLQADGHTMILRDIYKWFIKNTDKATASKTKGWQNSIRHNLSMNGAFEKVDHPDEDSRKGFMWRLTEQALREGVKSTTRYRSKHPNKRGTRNQQPQPQRQASGAKGGEAARRAANLKRSKRVLEYYQRQARSVPDAFDPNHSTTTTTYPPSPYYPSDTDFAYNDPTHFSPYAIPLDLFPPAAPYPHGAMLRDPDLVLPHSPADSLFTHSPTPSSSDDGPRTPLGQGQWTAELRLAPQCEFQGGGVGSQEYIG